MGQLRIVFGRAAAAALILCALGLDATQAQQPTPAQVSAIRGSCRSDFMANCSGVQPGGRDALQCLDRNVAKLSSACKTAVSAVMPPPAHPAATASAPTAPHSAAAVPSSPPATAVAPSQPAAAQTAAPAPTAAKVPAAATPKTPPRRAATATPGPRPPSTLAERPPARTAATAPPPAVAPLRVRRFILPQRRVIIVGVCHAEVRNLCADVPPGGGRILQCLGANAARLSPACYAAVARVSER